MNNVIILKYFVKQGRCAYPLLRFHDFIFHLFGIIGAAQVAGITIIEALRIPSHSGQIQI